MILVGFAMGDLANIGSGNVGFGSSSSTLAKAGGQDVTQRQFSDAMQRRLQQVRQQNPNADYSTIVGEFDRILDALIDERSLLGFAAKHGFHLSKRLVDAEIAQIPQTRGLNGQFSEQAYQGFLAQQRLTDRDVREIISTGLLERLMVAPGGRERAGRGGHGHTLRVDAARSARGPGRNHSHRPVQGRAASVRR
jgi:peptidyl-prolyl cis-trans isomerase D